MADSTNENDSDNVDDLAPFIADLLKEFNSDDAQGDLNRIQSAWGTKVPAELLAIAGLELYTVVDSLPDDSYYRGSLNVMLEDVDVRIN